MTTMPESASCQAPEKVTDDEIVRAIALFSEGLLSRIEFHALTGFDSRLASQYLADEAKLAAVQRASLRLRNSGATARLEALRHARAAVEIAADIMQDHELHPATRLNAATFITKVSGTERPTSESTDSRERHTIVINIAGNRPPLVISSAATRPQLTLEEQKDGAPH